MFLETSKFSGNNLFIVIQFIAHAVLDVVVDDEVEFLFRVTGGQSPRVLLNLRRNEGIVLRQWSNREDGVVTGLGFDVKEDSYQNNKTFVEMIKKFKNPQRKSQLKRWIILDNENLKTYFHEE